MIIDIITLIAILVFGIWGARRGLLRQIALIASILLMFLFASPIADIFVKIIADNAQTTIPQRYIHIAMVSLVSTTIFVIVNLAGTFLHKTLVDGIKPAETANKAFGFTIGAISCALAIYFIICLASCAMGWIEAYAPSLAQSISSSTAYSITKEYNYLEERMPEIAKQSGKQAESNDPSKKQFKLDTNTANTIDQKNDETIPSNAVSMPDSTTPSDTTQQNSTVKTLPGVRRVDK